jgi:cell shape-determining protein MreC
MLWPRIKFTRRGVFAILMLLSAASLFILPKEWSDPLKHVGQPLIWIETALYGVSYEAGACLSDLDGSRDHDRIESQALLHELASQIAVADELRGQNARLRGLREEWALPPTMPLLPARVVARDIVEWRDSLLVDRGSVRGVRRKDWAASRFFVDQGRVQGVAEGQAVLARECLLGRVEQVSPYMSRIQLFSDVDSPRIEVRIGGRRAEEAESGEAVEFVDYPCSLRGLGHGRMMIEDVPYNYVGESAETSSAPERRRIRAGDLVFSAPGQLGLPSPLVIGKIAELQEDPKKRLVYGLLVEPVVAVDQLRDVFVVPLVPPERIPIPE